MTSLTLYEYDIFLSHNHADEAWTAKLAELLEKEDWQGRKLRVFFSPWDIRPGQSIPKRIEEALLKSRKVGLIMSPDSIASAWVELERLVTTYLSISDRDERLLPLMRRDCEIPALIKHVLYVDFRDDAQFEENYKKLLVVIKDEPFPRVVAAPYLPLSVQHLKDSEAIKSQDKGVEKLRNKLLALRQLEQEELIGESLKQEYQHKLLDEWIDKE